VFSPDRETQAAFDAHAEQFSLIVNILVCPVDYMPAVRTDCKIINITLGRKRRVTPDQRSAPEWNHVEFPHLIRILVSLVH